MTKSNTVDSKEIKFMLDEVCFASIDAIKANLERLGWFEPHEESELPRVNIEKIGDIAVVDMYLDNEEVMIISYHHRLYRGKEDLSFLVMEGRITADYLLAVLKGLENVNAIRKPSTETVTI